MSYSYHSTWGQWTDSDSTSMTTSSTWGQWNSDYYYTSTATTNAVWVKWTDGATADCSYVVKSDNCWGTWFGDSYKVVFNPEQITKPTFSQRNQARIYREEQQRLAEERLAEEKRKVKESLVKSKRLLTDNLTEEQLHRFEQDECIPVDTAKGNKYLIRKNNHILKYNKEGKPEAGLCAHPHLSVPVYDIMLAQLLHLRANEEGLLKLANRHGVN